METNNVSLINNVQLELDNYLNSKIQSVKKTATLLIVMLSIGFVNAQEKELDSYKAFNASAHIKNMHTWHGSVVHPGAVFATSLEYNSRNSKFTAGLWGGAGLTSVDVVNKNTGENVNANYQELSIYAVYRISDNFFIEYLEQKVVDMDNLSFRFEHFKLECIWSLTNYKEIIDKSLDIIITKAPIFSSWEHPSAILFTFETNNNEALAKAHKYIDDFIKTHFKDRQRTMMIMSVALYRFHDKFISYLKQFLLLIHEN